MADYFFDGDNGNDTTGAGSEANPYKSIKASTVGGIFNPANARFFIKRGTTVLMAGEIHPNATFTFTSYGPSTDPKGRVVYNSGGSYFLACGTGASSGQEVVFDSIILEDAVASAASAVYQNAGNSAKIIVRDCEIEGFSNGVMTQGGTGHQVLRNNMTGIRNCGVIFEHTAAAAPSNTLCEDNYIDCTNALNDGIVYHAGTSNGLGNIARNNTIIAGLEQGIDVLSMYPGTLLERNVIYANPAATTSWSDIYCAGANSIIKHNLVFAGNRTGIYLNGAAIDVKYNTVISAMSGTASPLIYCVSGNNPKVVGNYLVNKVGFASSEMLVAGGINLGTMKNNIFVNYSASTSSRFAAWLTAADLNTWDIDNNYYVQMPGSHATPWTGNRSFAQWNALTGSPDSGTGIVATSIPLIVPTYQAIGQRFNLKRLFTLASNSPLIGVGSHINYAVDLNGRQFWNPPAIGPVDYKRP